MGGVFVVVVVFGGVFFLGIIGINDRSIFFVFNLVFEVIFVVGLK